MVVIGEKGRDVCDVQYRRSDDESWGGQSIEGPPEACQGGLVYAYPATQQEANSEIVRAESSPAAEIVRLVPLTGSGTTDEAAIQAEISALHEEFDPDGVGGEGDALGFMAPGTMENTLIAHNAPEPVSFATCQKGRIGQWRRADATIKVKSANTTVNAYVIYKRISCSQ